MAAKTNRITRRLADLTQGPFQVKHAVNYTPGKLNKNDRASFKFKRGRFVVWRPRVTFARFHLGFMLTVRLAVTFH